MTHAAQRISWLLVGSLLWLGGPALAGGARILEPHPSVSDNYGESFTFVADLEDGTYIWTQLSFTHLGPGSHHAICRALVVSPGKPTWTPNQRVGKGEWKYDPQYQMLFVGNCWAKEGDHPEVLAKFDDGSVRLRLRKPLQPFSPPGTSIIDEDNRYRASVLLANAPVEVTLEAPGSAPRTLKGGVYADHSHSTWPPAKLAKQWVRFRALKAEPYTLIVGRESKQGTFGPVYQVEEGTEATTFKRFDIRRKGEGTGTSWRVLFKGQEKSAVVRSTALLHRSAPVQDLGLLGSVVKPVVGSPVTYTHRAVLEREGLPPLEGLMEVTLEED